MPDPVLITSRLEMHSITPAVIHLLFTTKTEAEIKQFFGCDDSRFLDLKDMHEQGMETHRISHHYFLLATKEPASPIGECGFHTWNKKHRRAELFYFLYRDEFKRHGFVSEALQPVLDFGFNEMGLHRIEALVADWNTPSVRLMDKYGFTKEGTMREDYCVDGVNTDSDCYSLLKPEWLRQTPPANT